MIFGLGEYFSKPNVFCVEETVVFSMIAALLVRIRGYGESNYIKEEK